MSKKTDIRFGRRGGHFLPDDYTATDFNNAKLCDACRQPMILGQRQRHHACDPETMVAERCTCKPGCTNELVGDGPTDCEPDCVPCRLQRNRRHKDVPEWQRSKS